MSYSEWRTASDGVLWKVMPMSQEQRRPDYFALCLRCLWDDRSMTPPSAESQPIPWNRGRVALLLNAEHTAYQGQCSTCRQLYEIILVEPGSESYG